MAQRQQPVDPVLGFGVRAQERGVGNAPARQEQALPDAALPALERGFEALYRLDRNASVNPYIRKKSTCGCASRIFRNVALGTGPPVFVK